VIIRTFLVVAAVLVFAGAGISAKAETFPVAIEVHANKPIGEWKPVWRFFGADEPNYASLPDGRKLLGELGQLAPDRVFFRTHNLLNSGDGTPALKWGSTGVYAEDAQGQPVYSWAILDRIFDTYRVCGVRPYVEIGFMPEALSVKPEPYQHHWTLKARYGEIFTGWAYPPTNYAKWSELVYQWAKHDVVRYGRAEVAKWYWETWNEANIGYWQGTPPEFFRLHDCAVDAVRRALPEAKVGGPDSAGAGVFLRRFIEHCLQGTNFVTDKIGTPIDFISFHAKGAPVFTNDHVRMGVANQLRDINSGFGIVSSFPELKSTPIVIGESDPDGCAACQAPQLGYRNHPVYASYTTECVARELELADKHGVNFEGALTWAFEFEDQPPFAGFRTLASDGIDLPVLNAFRMLSKMGGQRLAVESDNAVALDSILRSGVRARADVSALASLESNRLCVLVWHYHDDDMAGPVADVNLTLDGLPGKIKRAQARHYRIDNDHSDAFTVWQRMGSPLKLSGKQYAELERAGQLAELQRPETIRVRDGQAVLSFTLPREAVSLLVIEWRGP